MSKHAEPTPLPRIAATYARVSSLAQDAEDKTSLDTQEAGSQRWAREHDWLLDDQFAYRDRHTGEELWERPALTRLREAARARQFGILVCHSTERLSRKTVHLFILVDELARLGIEVAFVTEPLPDSPEAQLLLLIRGYAGEVESERRRERQMRATHERVHTYKLPIRTGPAPYGYLWASADKAAYIIDPETAPIVVRIFTDYAHGKTLREIAAALTAEGIPTPTRQNPIWGGGVIRYLLRQSIYWGAPMTGKTRTEPVPLDVRDQYARKSVARLLPVDEQTALPADTAPALVSPSVALEVQRRLHTNQQMASHVAKDPESALLRGLVRCGLCGGSAHVNRRSPVAMRKDGTIPVRYVCRNALRTPRDATHGRKCTPHPILCETLDASVWDVFASALRDPRLITQELEQMRKTEPPGTADLAALDARLLTLARKTTSLMETAALVNDPDARRDLAAQIDLNATQKRQTESERTKVAQLAATWEHERLQLETLTEQITRVAAHLDRWDYAQKRAALIALKAEVTVYEPGHTPGRAELAIRLPLHGRILLDGAPSTGETQFVL